MAGNANSGRREKPFADALRMELVAAGTDHKKLRAIAAMLIEKASEGDMQAIKELADRTDGKPSQQMDIDANITTHEDWIGKLSSKPRE